MANLRNIYSLIHGIVEGVSDLPRRKKINLNIPDDISKIADVFANEGHELYVVGGAVRDALLNKKPKDYDLATDANPDEVIAMLDSMPDFSSIPLGKAFGVIVARTPLGNEYEIATFRQDIGQGRRPDAVKYTTIESDVMRRDLTINALFYDIETHEVIDYVGGIHDLQNDVIRTVGSAPQRFGEDRLRILRALRFAARFGGTLDPDVNKAIKRDNSLAGVSPERIRDEFLKGLKTAKNTYYFITLIGTYNLWGQIFPGLIVDVRQVKSHDPIVIIACLLANNDQMVVAKKLNTLKYTQIEVAKIAYLVGFQNLNITNAYELKKRLKNSHVTDSELIAFAREKHMRMNQVSTFIAWKLTVRGDDVMKAGFSGAEIGREIAYRENQAFAQLSKFN